MPSMKRQPPSCHVGHVYWPWSLPETACSVMHATSIPRALISPSAAWGSPSASPEIRLWLCRSLCTTTSDPPSFEEREAPVELPSPPSVAPSAFDPRACCTTRPPATPPSAFRKSRLSTGLGYSPFLRSFPATPLSRTPRRRRPALRSAGGARP